MTTALYLRDSYLQKFAGKVVEAEGTNVILDQTAFYPAGGGQPSDVGAVECDGKSFGVLAVRKSEQGIVHELDGGGLHAGDKITGTIDWQRRYQLMRHHTASHVLCAIIHRATGALITGNQIGTDKTRVDFNLPEFDKEKISNYAKTANQMMAQGLQVTTRFLPRAEALQIPGAVKLATALPPEITELRIVQIGDIDTQADGGTHVRNTSEVGKIAIVGAENKGKSNRRIYFALEP
ncbi:MAG: alanyl-tRNA editing protein [Candidatus Aenigmarchaeota archaeon]|nr:alanyl-tRNA editing protein [Candidatus Aenigmarchaeota archaeon]